jgi:hypothetical protein
LNLANLGIGNDLTNAIARHSVPNGSAAFAVLIVASLMMGAVVAVFWPMIDWVHICNVKTVSAQNEIGPAMAASIAIFLLSFPLSVISRTFNASALKRRKLSCGSFFSREAAIDFLEAIACKFRIEAVGNPRDSAGA